MQQQDGLDGLTDGIGRTETEMETAQDADTAIPCAGMGAGPSQFEMLKAVLNDCRDFSQFFELYYWSRDPEMLRLFRKMAALPPLTRNALGLFLSQGGEGARLSMERDDSMLSLNLHCDGKGKLQGLPL